ncbi:MAG TPA: oxidoreductase [Lacisediminihabitans sp.]|uniref:FAD-dependent oxidoreductase n=1 Tax=Lacisediminihabitans sp. TaxID=2787631 RepID=UPI002EDB80E3
MTAWLDRLTGRVTMYRLVVIVLGAIAAIAIVLSLIPGGLSFSPLQLLATLATSLVVTYLSNRLIALPFRVKPHSESSIITALLLFFLFFPTTDPHDLLVLALVAVIASASKYVLAIRGRHLFNPAAVAALIIAFTQLSAAVWWVGTPLLLAPVAIGAFLVVYRVRRFALVGLFVVVALAISIVRLSTGGMDVGTAVWFSIASSPILFMAGFMLDEPLTLPPLRWQQLTIAAVAAVIVEVPFHLGPLYNSPELGLVVGNLIAFFFGQRRAVRLDFVGSSAMTPSTRELRFAPSRPVAFRAGQYLEFTLPHRGADTRGIRRTFSIASAPHEGQLAFGLTVPPDASSFKRALLVLEPGDRLLATSVGGDFLLPRDPSVPLLLVAGGIGITPFISQLRHLGATGQRRDIVLVYAVSGLDELAYSEELAASGIRVLVVAPSEPPAAPEGWLYLGATRLTGSRIAEAVPDLAARTAYVSGPPALVTALKRDLRRLGVRRIRADYFSGY